AGPCRGGLRAQLRRPPGRPRRPRHHRHQHQAGQLLSIQRPGLRLRHHRQGGQRLLQVRQRPGRRERAQDRPRHLRRRLRAAARPHQRQEAGRAGQGVRAVQPSQDRQKHRHLGLRQPAEGAARVRRDRLLGLGQERRRPPVHDWLAAELPDRGEGLRRVPEEDQAERQGRRPVPERRLRQGAARRVRGRHRLLRGPGGRKASLTGQPPPAVASQVKKLAGSGADVFLDITTPKFAAQAIATVAQTTWKPLHILNNVAASKAQVLKPVGLKNAQGIVSTAYIKDPEDAQWANDAAMVAYKTNLAKYESGADANDPYNAYGWAVANNRVEALKQMKQPTRAALMDAARHLNMEIPLLLPGVKVQTNGSSDGYPIQAM